MYAIVVIAIFAVNTANCDRYTAIFDNDPFFITPSRLRRYRVFEGEEDIKQDSAGHKLRFAPNPHFRSSLRPRLFEDTQNERESRQFQPSLLRPTFHPPREEIRYGFRPAAGQEISHNRAPLLDNRKLLQEQYGRENPYTPLYYNDRNLAVRRPVPAYYINRPHYNRQIYQDQPIESDRQLKDSENQPRIIYSPVHPIQSPQKHHHMVYSPAYAYGGDASNPVASSSRLPLYVSDGDWQSSGHEYHAPHKSIGGEEIKKSSVDKEKKEASDQGFHEEKGKHEEELVKDEKNFKKQEEAVKSEVSDSGHFTNEEEKKKKVEDQEKYQGGKSYKQEEQNENEKKNKASHKKGHVIKRFKNSHHKEETGNNEEYYDEAHDADDSFKFDKSNGEFGEKKEESYKGDQEKKEYESREKVNKGEHENSEASEKVKEDKNENKESKAESSSKYYGNENHVDEESLLGHQESKRLHQETPFHVPFHRHL